jgi:hypothetical protein
MCTTRTPKPVTVQSKAEKRVQILRNPYLDGVDPSRRAQQVGVGSFRIDRGSGTARVPNQRPTRGASPVAPMVPAGTPVAPVPSIIDQLGPVSGRGLMYRALQISRSAA